MKSVSLFFKGVLLGLSMVLPGISAGTVAFIFGIYNKLIDEISQLNLKQIKQILGIFSFQKQKALGNLALVLKAYDWKFIAPLFFGFFLAVVLFVSLSLPLIEKYSLEFHALIFGLVLISLYSPFKRLNKNKINLFVLIVSFLINSCIFYFINESSIIFQEPSFFIFLPAGFLISMALVVPGISGSYLLILLGLYEKTLEVLRNLEVLPILFFLVGVIFGLIVTVHFMKVLIKKYYDKVLSVVIGLILGSLYGLWPFSEQSFRQVFYLETQIETQTIVLWLYMLAPVCILFGYKFFYRLFIKKPID